MWWKVKCNYFDRPLLSFPVDFSWFCYGKLRMYQSVNPEDTLDGRRHMKVVIDSLAVYMKKIFLW